MEKKPLILIGGGGHCKSCIEVIEAEGLFHIKGILDTSEKVGSSVLGYPLIGSDEDIPYLIKAGNYFLITLGQIKSAYPRKVLYNQLKSLGAQIATIISPKAIVSKHAIIGEGTIIMHAVNINADACIGFNNIINTGSNIEHDVVTGKHCHISTHAVLNGNCRLADEIFIGSGGILNNGVSIVEKVIIGAGSVIHKNITESGIFIGNPFRKI